MPIAVKLLAEPDIHRRNWSLLLLTVQPDPVELIALGLIGGRGMDGMIAESDQVVLALRAGA